MADNPPKIRNIVKIFDGIASEYDRYRPTYPRALFDDLCELSQIRPPARILELGSGTGKATVGFAERGFQVHCLEPGSDLIRVAQQKLEKNPSITFENTSFENWNADGQYDLVTSATAFHFMDPKTKYKRVAACLRAQKSFAPFSTGHVPSYSGVFEEIRSGYRQFAPHLDDSRKDVYDSVKSVEQEMQQTGLFSSLRVRTYHWEQVLSSVEFVGLLDTNSRHQSLKPETKKALYSHITEAIDRNGGQIVKIHFASLFVATKSH